MCTGRRVARGALPNVCLPVPTTMRANGRGAGLILLACSLIPGIGWAQQCVTSITGTVYAPNGTDPLPNILVFVPLPGVPLPTFSRGLDTVNGCATSGLLVPAATTASAITDAYGHFVLSSGNFANSETLVVQAGKWRRQYPNTPVTQCVNNVLPDKSIAMPADRTQGDLPYIAISTGAADAVECVFRKMGISDTEFTAANNPSPGHIQMYGSQSNNSGGAFSYFPSVNNDASGVKLPLDTALIGNPATFDSYDLALFGCTGHPNNPQAAVTAIQNNFVSYANLGGRILAIHDSFPWLSQNPVFSPLANWIADASVPGSSSTVAINATINQGFAEGVILSDWLQGIGATTTPGQMPLYQAKKDLSRINSPAQLWATLNAPSDGNPVMQFTFDTPLNSPTTPNVQLGFQNPASPPALGDVGDVITVTTDNIGTAPTLPSLTLTITVPQGLTPTSLVGSGGWTCAVSTLVCTRTASLAAGASDSVALTFNVPSNAKVGQATLKSVLTGGGLSGTLQCGRVLFDEYHVEVPTPALTNASRFPAECTTGVMTPQEKFLEFTLYNLSSFIAPSTTDTIDLVALPEIIWNNPAAITYHTALTGTQLNATAINSLNGTTVAGTFAYSYAGIPISATSGFTGLPVGVDTLSVKFTPSDLIDYGVMTKSVQILVNGTPTSTVLAVCVPGSTGFPCPTVAGALPAVVTPVNEAFGLSFLASAAVTAVDASTVSAASQISVYDLYNGASTVVCTFPLSTPTCPSTAGTALGFGTHVLTAIDAGDVTHAGSTSNAITVNVVQDATSVIVTSSADPALAGASVTFTATVTGNGTNPGSGTVTFYDAGVAIGTGTLAGSNTATFSTSGLSVGTHPITAIYTATTAFAAGTSAVLAQVIVAPAAALGTAVSLTSSNNRSPVGLSVTFTAAVTTVGPFTVIPTGTVTFLDGATVLGTKTLDGTGSATFSTSSLKVGTHSMTASYAGSPATTAPPKPGPVPVKGKAVPSGAFTSGLAASVSAVLPQVITTLSASQPTGFTLTAGPSPVTVGAGEYATLQVQVLQFSGFYQPVSLGCSGLPAMMSCVFQTTTIGSGGGSTVLYVLPQGPETCGTPPAPYYSSNGVPWLPLGGPLVAGLGLLVSPKRRRRWSSLLGLAMVTAAMTMVSGCGTCTNLGIQPGSSYTFTLTATQVSGGTAAQSVPITVNVVMP